MDYFLSFRNKKKLTSGGLTCQVKVFLLFYLINKFNKIKLRVRAKMYEARWEDNDLI